MAFPTITFNGSTGSDTAASGAGPSTAVTGTAAAHTGGSASTTVTLTNTPDLSGVAADGSAVLWLKTASGRQYSAITAKDDTAKTLTVADSLTIASGSPVDYAIGGKRATFDHADSRTLFADSSAGWAVVTETDQTLADKLVVSAAGDNNNGHLVIKGDSTSSRRTLTVTTNAATVQVTGASVRLANLEFACSAGTKTSNHGFQHTGTGRIYMKNCVMSATNPVYNGVYVDNGNAFQAWDCDFSNCVNVGVWGASNFVILSLHSCNVNANGSYGVIVPQLGTLEAFGCLITGNGNHGVYASGQYTVLHLVGNTVHGNTGSGVHFSDQTVQDRFTFLGNQFTGNTSGYGLRGFSGVDRFIIACDYNNFGSGGTANSSGDVLSVTKGGNDLNVDPEYANAAGGDFSVGTAVKALGFPPSTRALGAGRSGTTTYVDVGAAQRQEATGGGEPTGGRAWVLAG